MIVKRRILQIISASAPSGVARQLCLLARGLPRDRFDVHVCTLASYDKGMSACGTGVSPVLHSGEARQADQDSAGISTTVIGRRWQYDLQAYWELKNLVGRLRPDLTQTWTSTAGGYGLAAAKANGVKNVVAGFYCVDPGRGIAQAAIDRYVGTRSTRLTASSSAVRDFYARKGLPAERFRVIASGVAPPRASTKTRRQLLTELGLPEDSRLVGLVSRLFTRNRVKDAIWAADLLKVIRKDMHLLIIGEGPRRRRLRQFRDQVRIGDLVHFLDDHIDLSRLMPHLDMLWSTSAYEGQSSAILEAMAAGVPVVAIDSPSIRELVVHQQTGFLVPEGDRTEMAGCAYQLFEDPALARRVGEAARERALREFPLEKMIAGHIEMYGELPGNGK